MKFHSIYNTNPPTPVILPSENNPTEDYYEEIIAEHNFEESYEKYEIITYTDIDECRNKELIKNAECI